MSVRPYRVGRERVLVLLDLLTASRGSGNAHGGLASHHTMPIR
ncbi:hypothetical protein [Streptomyces luteireticuli]